jgi:hypothetical protein
MMFELARSLRKNPSWYLRAFRSAWRIPSRRLARSGYNGAASFDSAYDAGQKFRRGTNGLRFRLPIPGAPTAPNLPLMVCQTPALRQGALARPLNTFYYRENKLYNKTSPTTASSMAIVILKGHGVRTIASFRRSLRNVSQCETPANIVATVPRMISATPNRIAFSCRRTDSAFADLSRRVRKNPTMPKPKVANVSVVRIQASVVRSSAS